jgi:3-deoxy-D-manno-octulosonic-acid transferase
MNLNSYKFLSIIFYPFIFLYLVFRLTRGKEDKKRFKERFGYASISRPNSKLIWFHASSVGESLSILPIIEHINNHHSEFKILVTTGTINSAKIMQKRLPENAFHQYVPIDSLQAVNRFLDYWDPSLVIWTESEFWPNLLRETVNKCPIILVNGRISDNSFATWKKHKLAIKKLLGYFSIILSQSYQDDSRFKELGAENVHYTGNLKYCSPAPSANEGELLKLKSQIGAKVVLMAASTHSKEEQKLAEIYQNLKAKNPNLFLIIAPRHPARMEEILEDFASVGNFKVAVRSQKQEIELGTDIYLADTIGEYGIFYRLSEIVFIGGSLIPHGGQNLLEPARLSNVIIMGPYMHNFKEISERFLEEKAGFQVESEFELEEEIGELLKHPEIRQETIKNALDIVSSTNGILKQVTEVIDAYIAKI